MLGVAAFGCASGLSSEHVTLTDGTTLQLEIPTAVEETEGEDRIRWRLESGLTVAAQWIPRRGAAVSGEREPSAVARALAARFRLSEREGELDVQACEVAGEGGTCVSGWSASPRGRVHRAGLVFRAGEQLVWLEVTGAATHAEDVQRALDAVRGTVRIEA